MPNIMIVGCEPSLKIRDDISRIVIQLGVETTDGVITYDSELFCVDMTAQQKRSPYLIVRDTNDERAMRIAEALNEELNIDVEVEVLRAFLPRPK